MAPLLRVRIDTLTTFRVESFTNAVLALCPSCDPDVRGRLSRAGADRRRRRLRAAIRFLGVLGAPRTAGGFRSSLPGILSGAADGGGETPPAAGDAGEQASLPNLTFTYETPPEEVRPSYRLALVFDPANDLTAARVCSGQTFLKPPTPGRLYVFGVFCRDDLALSQTTAWTQAAGPRRSAAGPTVCPTLLVLFDDRRWRRFPFEPRFGR